MHRLSSEKVRRCRTPESPNFAGVTAGGTGAATASAARTNLGIELGVDVQAWDADLDAIAALSASDGNFIVGNGSVWITESGATARTSLGVDDEFVEDIVGAMTTSNTETGIVVTYQDGDGTLDFVLDYSSLTNRTIADTAATDSFSFNNGGVVEQIDIQDMGLRVVNLSVTQTFALGDANNFQVLTGSTDRDWTIPPNSSVAFGIGTIIYGGSRDTATLGIDPGAAVTLTSKNASGTATQDIQAGGMFCLIKVLTDEWMLAGDLV